MHKKNNILSYLIQICIITMLAALLSTTVVSGLTSLPAFKSMVEENDFQMSDLYNRVWNNKTVRLLSQEVVIVTVDGMTRNQIAQTIESVSLAKPKVVGVDIIFEFPNENDSVLINNIDNSNAVMAAIETSNGEIITSYFCDSLWPIGFVNMLTSEKTSVIREFRPAYSQGTSFAAEIVKMSYPSQYEILMSKGSENEQISYPLTDFMSIPADSIILGYHLKELTGKIVLIGDAHNMADMHTTPIGTMSGINIQASIIETIIRGKYTHTCPAFVNWLIAILSCMLIVALNFLTAKKMPAVGKLIMRIVQLSMLYLFFIIGCHLFINKQIYVDFSLSLVMIALGLLAYDIWIGVEAICRKTISYFKQKKL